jgi:hypothetical protein
MAMNKDEQVTLTLPLWKAQIVRKWASHALQHSCDGMEMDTAGTIVDFMDALYDTGGTDALYGIGE